MFRLESYLLYIFYIWSIWTLTSRTVNCANLILDCTESIILTSPNYPSLYPNDAFLEWSITAPPTRRILLTFNDFSLENPADLFSILDMYHKKFYTGVNMQYPPYLTSGHTLNIEFTSSRSGRRTGFNISVSCNELSSALSSRLVDGASPAEGFLELPTQSGEWKRVCEDSLTESVAGVICGELGYPGFKEISYEDSTCALDHLKDNCTRAPTCNPNTHRLVDCTAEHSVCSSEKAVKIKCHEPGYKGCYVLKTVALQNSSSFTFSSTAHCIYLCKTLEIQAIAIMDQIECFCSTSAEVHLEDAPKCSEDPMSLSKFSVYDASVGFCKELNDTTGGSWHSNITWFGSIVHLTCIDGYSLNGNGTLQCVPGLSTLNPVWNDSTPDCVMDTSVGFCEELNDTTGGSWDFKITWFGSVVHLTCTDGYSLKGIGTLQCVPGLTPYFPIWNDSFSTCEMIEGSTHSYRTTEIQEDYGSTFFDEVSTQFFNDHETKIMTDGYTNVKNDDCTYILLPILIGSTVVLFLLLLAVTISWIIPQIWKHFLSKPGSDSQIIHTYLDMRGRSPGDEENVSVTSPIGGTLGLALISTHPHDTVAQGENESKTNRNTIIYETIPLSNDDSNVGHLWDTDIDDFNYVLPNSPTNLKENVTLLHGEEVSCKTLLDEDGYLVLTM